MNELRAELKALLDVVPTVRPPALRRSLRDDALYATDLPAAADRETVEAFLRATGNAGWTARKTAGWIELDKAVRKPPRDGFHGPFGPEADCLLHLLRRHRPGENSPEEKKAAAAAVRMLIKAGEAGPDAFEKACAQLHADWAVRLRTGLPLPDLDDSFFENEALDGIDGRTGIC